MTTTSWISIVVFAYLAGAATLLYVGMAWYKRMVVRLATRIEEMTNQ